MEEQDAERKRNYQAAFAESNPKDQDPDRPTKKSCYYLAPVIDYSRTSKSYISPEDRYTGESFKTEISIPRALTGLDELYKRYPTLANSLTDKGDTILRFAIQEDRLETVIYLCQEHPESLTKLISSGVTPLEIAAYHMNLEILHYFYKNHRELLPLISDSGITSLHCVVEEGLFDAAIDICQSYPDLITKVVPSSKATILHAAARRGRLKFAKYLCENHPELILMVDSAGRTALHHAVTNHDIKLVKYLYKKQPILILTTDNKGETALHHAANAYYLEMVEYLCQEHQNLIPMPQNNGKTAFEIAAYNNRLDVVEYLCTHYPSIIRNSCSVSEIKFFLSDQTCQPIINFVTQFERIAHLGLIPEISFPVYARDLNYLEDLDLELIGKMVHHQPLNLQRENLIISALAERMRLDCAAFDRLIKKVSLKQILVRMRADPTKQWEMNSDEEIQTLRSTHEKNINSAKSLMRIYQDHRLPNLSSLVLTAITKHLIANELQGGAHAAVISPEDFSTLSISLATLNDQTNSFNWQAIVPGMRFNAKDGVQYLEAIQQMLG